MPRKKPTDQPTLIPEPGATTMTVAGLSGSGEAVASGAHPLPTTQLERIAPITAEREAGEREGVIKGMAIAAEIASGYVRDPEPTAYSIREDIINEAYRLYGANDPRVLHHLRLRNLA